MDIVQLFEALAARGLSVVRHTCDRLRCLGDPDQLTPDLQQALQRHRDVFLSLLPSPEDRCRQIVADAIKRANASCPPSWVPTDRQWEAMDEFGQRMHDAARAGDVEWTKAAAAEYVRACETCFLADAIHEWKPGAEVHWKTQPQRGAVRRGPPVRQPDLAFDL